MSTITKEIVESVMKYTKKYPNMSIEEVAKLCGIAKSSVSNIRNGMYKHLLEEADTNGCVKTVASSIPYDTYKRLVTCELAIKEIFASARKTLGDSEELFVDYRHLSRVLERYFPAEFESIRK